MTPKNWIVFKISAICLAVVLTIHIALLLLVKADIYLYFGSFNSEEILNVVTAILSLLFGASVIFLLLCFKKIRVLAVIVAVILGQICVFSALLSVFFHMDYAYYEMVSPDGRHKIIVKEESFLFGCSGEFYQKTSSVAMRKIGEYQADDYCTMADEMYKTVWLEDGFEFEYYYGNGLYKTVTVEYYE